MGAAATATEMSSSEEYVQYVCDQCAGLGAVRSRKMFGEYMVYVNDKPLLMVCDDTTFVKQLPAVAELMAGAEIGPPYPNAKDHWILDVDDRAKAQAVVAALEAVVPVPKPRKRKKKTPKTPPSLSSWHARPGRTRPKPRRRKKEHRRPRPNPP